MKTMTSKILPSMISLAWQLNIGNSKKKRKSHLQVRNKWKDSYTVKNQAVELSFLQNPRHSVPKISIKLIEKLQ